MQHRQISMKPQTRNLAIRAEEINVDTAKRSVELSFSSDAAIDMWYGKEILSHEPGAMRVTERSVNLPLLYNHEMGDLLGVVESIRLDSSAGKGYAIVRFGKDDRGEWAMQQCRDGILTNVSFMYRVYKYEEDTETETYTALDWEVMEISLVTIPADASVGVGRSAHENEFLVEIHSTNSNKSHRNSRSNIMLNQENLSRSQRRAARISEESQNEMVENERQRAAEITAMCRNHGLESIGMDLIQSGASIEDARKAVLEEITSHRGSKESLFAGGRMDGYLDMSAGDTSNFSIVRAINAAMTGNWEKAGLERAASRAVGDKMGRSTEGFFVPVDVLARSAYAVGTAGQGTTGGTLVATNLLAGSFIEVLRNKTRVVELGATILPGLVGNVDIPRQTSATATSWISEGGDLTEAEATFDKVSLAPKTIGSYSMISRNMLMQSTPAIEALVRSDLAAQLALGVDRAAVAGTGSNSQPTGIMNQSGIGSVIGGTNGAAITFDHLIDLVTSVSSQNADFGQLGFLTNPKVVGALTKLKDQNGRYLWPNRGAVTMAPGAAADAMVGATATGNASDFSILGYPLAATNQVPSNGTKGTSSGVCSAVIFGNWSDLLIGEWGVIEIIPNPYDAVAYKQGAIMLRAMQSIDVGVRHGASFAVMSDALTA